MSSRSRVKGMFAGARITPGALYLLFAEVGFSLVYLFADGPSRDALESYLTATPASVWTDLKVWTLVTSTFLKPDFITLIFHGLILWMFVPTLERWWGMKRFLIFALATATFANLVGTLVGTMMEAVPAPLTQPGTMAGLDPFIWASVIAYGVLFARQQVQFFGVLPLTAKQFSLGMLAFATVFVVLEGRWAVGAGWAAGILLAWALTSEKVAPKLWLLQYQHKRAKRHLKVVPKDASPKRWMN